ncbi:MAG: ATP-binding protein [Planctomycetota bacterium]
MKSIRSYLLSRLLGGSAVVLTGAAIVVYLVVTRSLEAQFDRNLHDRMLGLASVLFQVEDRVEFEFSDQLMPEYQRAELPAYFELTFDDGRLLEGSDSLHGAHLARVADVTEGPAFWTAPLPDGRTGRFVAELVEVHHVYPEEGPKRPQAAKVNVVVARGVEELLAARGTVLAGVVAVSLTVLALLGFLSWTAVTRGLEPADRLATALDRVRVDRLPKSLHVGPLPSELVPMAEKANSLIARVDTALERERRTSADIAHELRNPISELLTVSEVALRDEDDVPSTRRALGTVRDIAWRMGGRVSTLLKLARLEMGAEGFDCAAVDLGALVQELGRSLSALQHERGLRFDDRVAAGDTVEGDADVLRIVVSNLLSNALYYAPRKSTVECRLERSGGEWRFVVENEAADLVPDDLRFLSEPFWRKDRARADGNRSGLGLALSRALAEQSGMDLSFALENGMFRATLACASTHRNGSAASPAADTTRARS